MRHAVQTHGGEERRCRGDLRLRGRSVRGALGSLQEVRVRSIRRGGSQERCAENGGIRATLRLSRRSDANLQVTIDRPILRLPF